MLSPRDDVPATDPEYTLLKEHSWGVVCQTQSPETVELEALECSGSLSSKRLEIKLEKPVP